MDGTPRATAAALAAVALLVSACATASDSTAPTPVETTASTSPDPTPTPSGEPSEDPSPVDPPPALVTSLGVSCDGLGGAPALGEHTITFVVDGQLHEVSRAGGRSVCLADGVAGDLDWGRQGDRVAVGEQLLVGTDGPRPLPVDASGRRFTRPTGTSTLSVRDDGRVLAKTAIDDGTVTDISFLADHDEAIYYPSGTHILTIGTHADGRYGIWLSTNTGGEAKLLGEPEPGVVLSGLHIDPAGVHLIFAADHGDEHHVHRVRMLGESFAEGSDESAVEPILTSAQPFGAPVAWVDGWAVAAAAGTCADGGRDLAVSHEDGLLRDGLPAGDTVPVGWISYGELVVAVAPDACVGTAPAELWLLSTQEDPQLVVAGATAAALRTRDGDAPPPPIENFSGFA